MSDAIVAEGLVKTYGGKVRALDGVDLSVQEGTVLGLLGPNGPSWTPLTASSGPVDLLHIAKADVKVIG